MKLWLLQLRFRGALLSCKITFALDRWAQAGQLAIWRQCTRENLASCNERQGKRTRFC